MFNTSNINHPTTKTEGAANTPRLTLLIFAGIYWPLPGAFAALFPSFIASASVMYLPFLVVP